MSADIGAQLTDTEGRRLWIGNLDQRVTEFVLIKLLQKYGSLEKFDYLYHKTGPDAGKPRGYCFVTYTHLKDAEKTRQSLDGKLALGKRLIVRLAHAEEDGDSTKPRLAVQQEADPTETLSVDSKIRAIEMKLNHMEKTSQDFAITTKPSAIPGTSKYSSSQANSAGAQGSRVPGTGHHSNRSPSTAGHQAKKPYVRRDRYK